MITGSQLLARQNFGEILGRRAQELMIAYTSEMQRAVALFSASLIKV